MTTRMLGIVAAVACSISATAEATTNLKPFEPVALQGVVEATAKELLLPGAMVLLRTPQGDFAFGYGMAELNGTTPLHADTHFRAASNTKTMMAAVIVLLVQEGKLRFDDSVSKYVEGVPNGDKITISQLLKCEAGCTTTLQRQNSGKASTATRQELGPRRSCSALPLDVRTSPCRATNTIIATPTMSCSGSSLKNLKARRWQKFFRIDCSGRSA